VNAPLRARLATVGITALGLFVACTTNHYHYETAKPQPKTASSDKAPKTLGTPDYKVQDAPCGAFGLAEDNSVQFFAATRHYTWEPGITLNAQFLDGSPDKWAKVKHFANEWTHYANINFKFYPPNQPAPRGPTIRISFQRNGYWSIIGSQAAYRPKTVPTMNFNFHLFTRSDREIRRVVLHEFGHALGLFHEHQNPKIHFTWNKPLMYAYYRRTQGWDAAKVDSNIFRRLNPATTKATDFDPDSIMLYSFPPQFTKEHVRLHSNWVLSATDKREISKLYPGRWKPGSEPRQPHLDKNALARRIRFTATIVSKTSKFSNYSISMVAPDSVIAKIDHVLYQRQHRTFPEFNSHQYYRVTTRSNNFKLSWRGYSWHPVKAKVVYKDGQVSVHMHRAPPTRIEAGPNWNRLARMVKFKFTKKPDRGKWSIYRVELDAPDAVKHIAWIEYQRQHSTFAEYPQHRYLRRRARSNNFAIWWRGYSAAPIGIHVQFNNGQVKNYRINRQPVSTFRIGTQRYRSANGYSIVLPRGWKRRASKKERWYRPGNNGFADNLGLKKMRPMVLSASAVKRFRGAVLTAYRRGYPDFSLAYYGKRMFGNNEAIYLIGSFTSSGQQRAVVQAMIADPQGNKTVIVTCVMDKARYVSIAQTCERSFDTVDFN